MLHLLLAGMSDAAEAARCGYESWHSAVSLWRANGDVAHAVMDAHRVAMTARADLRRRELPPVRRGTSRWQRRRALVQGLAR